MKGPDEVFAMNATQTQIDKLVERANEMNQRLVGVENLTGSLVQQENDKSAVELKGMMSNLKNKFTFLDPASDETEAKNLSG